MIEASPCVPLGPRGSYRDCQRKFLIAEDRFAPKNRSPIVPTGRDYAAASRWRSHKKDVLANVATKKQLRAGTARESEMNIGDRYEVYLRTRNGVACFEGAK